VKVSKDANKSIRWEVKGNGPRHHCSTPYSGHVQKQLEKRPDDTAVPSSRPTKEPVQSASIITDMLDIQTTKKRPHLIPSLIAAAMLLLALVPWPYGYYQLLRFVVSGVAVYIASMVYQKQRFWATYLFGFVAILFNPLIPIHLSRKIWQPIDVICAILFIGVASILQKPVEKKNE